MVNTDTVIRTNAEGQQVVEALSESPRGQWLYQTLGYISNVDVDSAMNEVLWVVPMLPAGGATDYQTGLPIVYPSSIPVYGVPGGARAFAEKMGTRLLTWYLMSTKIAARWDYKDPEHLGAYLQYYGLTTKEEIPMYPYREKPETLGTEGMSQKDLSERATTGRLGNRGAITRLVQRGARDEVVQAAAIQQTVGQKGKQGSLKSLADWLGM